MDPDREKEFLKVLKIFPDDALTRFGLANFYRDAGRQNEAIEQYQKVITNDPGYGAAYLELGSLQEDAGDLVEAGKTYRQAITAAEEKGDLHLKNRAKMRLEDLN